MAQEVWNSPEPLFAPRSVAILGASERPGSWANVIYHNLELHGFSSPIFPVNPKYQTLWGKRCFASVRDIPEEVDQIIALIPSREILPALKEGAQKGCRSAIIISGGFAETESPEGKRLEEDLRSLAGTTSLRVCGPNCVGLFSVWTRFFPSTYGIEKERVPLSGGLSMVFQSGGFLGNLLQSGTDRGLGFRYLVSSGNEAGLDIADYVNYFVADAETKVIALFIEGIRNADKFLYACARAREKRKPVVAMKLGRSERGRAAALSHTGSMAGTDEVYDAVFRKYGVIRVDDPDRLLETVALFLEAPLPQGPGVGVLTNSGGLRGMVCDTAERLGVSLPRLSPATTSALDEFLSVGSKVDNPLDGGWGVVSSPRNFRRSMELLLQDPSIHLVAMQGKLPDDPDSEVAGRFRAAAELAQKYAKPVVVFSIFSHSVSEAARLFKTGLGIPFLQGLDETFQAVRAMTWYGSVAAHGSATTADRDAVPTRLQQSARGIVGGRRLLTEVEAKELLRLYGIPCASEALAATAAEAGKIAGRLGYPVALKLISPQITHKSDAGAVRLNVGSRGEAEKVFAELVTGVRRSHPQAEIRGILVQEMVCDGVEAFLGVHRDPQFGPIILFGLGGIFVEALGDVVYVMPPIGRNEAEEVIHAVKGYPVLAGYRGQPADVVALSDCLVKLGQLALDLRDELASLDINPVKVLPAGKGVKVIDALAVLAEGERRE